MKKIFYLILVLLLSLSFVACSSNNSQNTGENSSSTTKDKEDIVVGFIFIGPIGDEGWTFAHNEGRLQLEKELGIKTLYKESVLEDASVKPVVANMIDQGATVIIATSFGYMDYLEELAKQYPDVKFLHCSGFKKSENMSNYFGRMYEPRFLSGLVAGLKTKTNKLGYVAAFEISEVIRGINAYTLGAQTVNKDIQVDVVWTHTWYDSAKEKEAAISLLNKGCDVIAQHQDTPGPIQAAEEVGKFAIGYNTSAATKAPKAYMTAPIWNFGPYYISQVKDIMNGTWKSDSYWGHMKDGIVLLDTLTDVVPSDAKKIVDDYTLKINSEEFHVFQGPIYDQDGNLRVKEGEVLNDEQMLSMDWFVKGVNGKVK